MLVGPSFTWCGGGGGGGVSVQEAASKSFPLLKMPRRCTQIRQREREREETLTQMNIVLTHWNQHKHQSQCSSTAVFPGTVRPLAEEPLNKNHPCHQLGGGRERGLHSLWRTKNCAPPPFFLAPSLFSSQRRHKGSAELWELDAGGKGGSERGEGGECNSRGIDGWWEERWRW